MNIINKSGTASCAHATSACKNMLSKLLTSRSSVIALALTIGLTTDAGAMDIKTALEIALQTNPEIAEAAANRRALGFEYEQAKRLNRPTVIIEGRAGPEWVDTRTTRLLGNDDDVLFGKQASVTMQQNLLSFGRNGSERDYQASRVVAAANRVVERSEFVALDTLQAYFDVMRLREILAHADKNVAYHQFMVDKMTRLVGARRNGEADAQQARERLEGAKVSHSETSEALKIAEADFIRLVGREIGKTTMPPSVQAPSLEKALGDARRNNPTLKIANQDLDTARANYRKSKAALKPEVFAEVVGRAGDDIGGFRDTSNDVRAQLRVRYEFRGGIKSSSVQEHLNRIDESRAKLMGVERNVENVVREAWQTQFHTASRVRDLEAQVREAEGVLNSYERLFDNGGKTLLDNLDAQASLFQAQSSLTTSRHADKYARYRLLASTGTLLEKFGLKPRREADTSLKTIEKIEPLPVAETEPRRNPEHYDKTMGNYEANAGTQRVSLKPVIAPSTKTVSAKSVKKTPAASMPKAVVSETASSTMVSPVKNDAIMAEQPVKAISQKTVTSSYKVSNSQTATNSVASAVKPTPAITYGRTIEVVKPSAAANLVNSTTVQPAVSQMKPVVRQAITAAPKPVTRTGQNLTPKPVVPVRKAQIPDVKAPSGSLLTKTVNRDEYDRLSRIPGAYVNAKMQTVMVDNILHILQN